MYFITWMIIQLLFPYLLSFRSFIRIYFKTLKIIWMISDVNVHLLSEGVVSVYLYHLKLFTYSVHWCHILTTSRIKHNKENSH